MKRIASIILSTALVASTLAAISSPAHATDEVIEFTVTDFAKAVEHEGKCIDLKSNVRFTYGDYRNGILDDCSYGKTKVASFKFPLKKKFVRSDTDAVYRVISATSKQLTGLTPKDLIDNNICEKNIMNGVSCTLAPPDLPYIWAATVSEGLDYMLVMIYIKK